MPASITLVLPDQFRIACILNNIRPEDFLSAMMANVILPSEYWDREPANILVTECLLEYALQKRDASVPYTEEQLALLRKKESQRIRLLKNSVHHHRQDRQEALRIFFAKWLKEWIVLEDSVQQNGCENALPYKL